MATDEEVRLGRLVVKGGHATEEQVLDALRTRNQAGKGDLGDVLIARGLVSARTLAELRVQARAGQGTIKLTRADASTDHEISIQSTREVLARDQLEEARATAAKDPAAAHRELVRLAAEFADTESGVRAGREAEALAAKHPELRRPKPPGGR